MIRVGIVTTIFFAISVIAFNNCSSTGFNVVENALNSASSQCRAKIMNSAKAELFLDGSLCENAANYACDLRHFRKGVGMARSQQTICQQIAGVGEACVPVSVYNFDTSDQQQTAEASQLVEGGSYNRDEASCINTQIVAQQIPVIQEEGSSVADALERSIASCRQRSRQ